MEFSFFPNQQLYFFILPIDLSEWCLEILVGYLIKVLPGEYHVRILSYDELLVIAIRVERINNSQEGDKTREKKG